VARVLLPSVVQIETGTGVGSGVVYRKGGLILTAAHVVEGVDDVDVRLASGRRMTAKVLGAHRATDVAVLRAKRRGLPPARLALRRPVRVGQVAVAIGSPFGLAASVTSGVVSAVERPIPLGGGTATMIQTDAPINPGNSGGALADREARVIGINDMNRTTSGSSAGVGFAIPIDVAARVADALVDGRKPRLGYLGVVGSNPFRGPRGALVTHVQPGTPAAKASLRRGDLIVSYDGKPVRSMAELASAIRLTQPGKQVTIEVLRSGGTIHIDVRIGAQ
jgi:S1-C subfamily serine protease